MIDRRPASSQPIRLGQTVPARPVADNSGAIADLTASLADLAFKKANASTVGGLTTRLNGIETRIDAKADATAVGALAASMPIIADETPQPEKTGGAPGIEGNKVPGVRHQHPRLTSTTGNTPSSPTAHTIGQNGLATVAFTRSFANPPGTVFTEVPPITGTMSTFPASFRVESWVRETMTPVPSGAYVGCVVRAWRGQALPIMGLLSGLLNLVGVNGVISALTGFNVFGAPASGTSFTCIAVARSDT